MRSLIIRPIQAGFTLVELLIVVIIIAILAAIIVPQFSSATLDAQESALDANLAAMRSAIELYRAQHSGKYPGNQPSNLGCATKGSGAADSNQAFMDQLLLASDATGATCAISDTTYKFGPYVRKGIPNEPINSKGSLVADISVPAPSTGAPFVTGTGATASCATCGTTGGWKYDTLSGQIIMNSSTQKDSKGNFYFTH
jgi:general secretion pathway protein G